MASLPLKRARSTYYRRKSRSIGRNIEFLLTFEEWYNWWLSNGVDMDSPRPFNGDTLCMCRKNDLGSYSLDNIYCATQRQNNRDRWSFVR